jgi:hypothetical protein
MSALGQKQTFAVQKGMSALPPKATDFVPLLQGRDRIGIIKGNPRGKHLRSKSWASLPRLFKPFSSTLLGGNCPGFRFNDWPCTQ